MIANKYGLRLTIAAAAFLMLHVGCTDNSTGNNVQPLPLPDAEGGDIGFSDTGAHEDIAEDTTPELPKGGEKLEFVEVEGDDGQPCKGTDRCAIFMSFNGQRNMEVKATRDGKPASELSIKWEVTQKGQWQSLQLGSKSTFTTMTGDSVNTAKQTAQQEAQYEVKAFIDGAADATPLYFDIAVTPKGQVPLIVSYTYNGKRVFQGVTTYLYKQESPQKALKCADVTADTLPTADLSSPPKSLTQSAAFPSLPGLGGGQGEDQQQTYTIVGIGKDADTDAPPLVIGCDDKNGGVTYTGSTSVTIELTDLPPEWKGKYDLTSKFDLVSALPENIGNVVNIVLGFFTDPAGQLLVLVCDLAGGDGGVIGDLCGFVFKDPANPCIEPPELCLDSVGIAATKLLNQALESLLSQNEIAKDIFYTGQDISKILKKLELGAVFEFKEEPKSDGTYTSEITNAEFITLTYRWTLGTDCDPADESCGKRTFNVAAFQGNTIVGAFGGKVTYGEAGEYFLNVDPFSLDINYGALANYILQKEVLPLIFGDGKDGGFKIDSYEEMLKVLLGGSDCLQIEQDSGGDTNCCDLFATSLAGGAGIGEDIAKAACNAGLPLLSENLENVLVSLDVDSANFFTLETKEPCQAFDNDADLTIDTWGKSSAPCHWNTTFGMSTVKVENDFWAVEQQ